MKIAKMRRCLCTFTGKSLLKFIVPFVFLFILFGILTHELFYAKPYELPSALIGQRVPTFQLSNLLTNQKKFTQNDLLKSVSLLNVWATWCYACLQEHDVLMQISKQYKVPIYGIVYKDDPKAVQAWLKQKGNPFVLLGNDTSGDVAIDFGVYGTPETFLVADGKIIYRHIGAVDVETWEKILYPLIKRYAN